MQLTQFQYIEKLQLLLKENIEELKELNDRVPNEVKTVYNTLIEGATVLTDLVPSINLQIPLDLKMDLIETNKSITEFKVELTKLINTKSE